MEGSSTSMRPVLWSASGPKIAMKLVALGQLVENCQDWPAPRVTGKTSATTQAPQVRARARPAGAAAMNRSTAYPTAMAANQAPSPTCLFSEAAVCSRAWFSGPATAAAARTASSQVCAQPRRPAQLMITPHTARTKISPAQDHELASTDHGEFDP